jgi:hypothetical protein
VGVLTQATTGVFGAVTAGNVTISNMSTMVWNLMAEPLTVFTADANATMYAYGTTIKWFNIPAERMLGQTVSLTSCFITGYTNNASVSTCIFWILKSNNANTWNYATGYNSNHPTLSQVTVELTGASYRTLYTLINIPR